MKDTFLRGAERGEGRGEGREKLQRGVKAAQGIVVCLAPGGVLSVGVNFQDGIIPSQPNGSELPGWDYTWSAQMCEMLGKARLRAVAFRGHTLAEAGGTVCALSRPLQPMGRQMPGAEEKTNKVDKHSPQLASGVCVLLKAACSGLKPRIQKAHRCSI